MRTAVVRIGNSRGIRIPKAVLEQCGFGSTVDLVVEGDALIVRRVDTPRAGWENAFRQMHEQGDDALLDRAVETEWDQSEWEW